MPKTISRPCGGKYRSTNQLGYDFGGVYVGGGTPTILIDELEETLAQVRRVFSIREISVETNPNHLTGDNIAILKRAGTNRLSVGIQSFDDSLLKAMGRYHKYGDGASIAAQLRKTLGCFDTLNADMIFNFPSQTEASLAADLDILAATGVDQVTYYPLMVSEFDEERRDAGFGGELITGGKGVSMPRSSLALCRNTGFRRPGVFQGRMP